MKDAAHPLAAIALFKDLPPRALQRLGEGTSTERGRQAGGKRLDQIFRMGDAADAVFAITAGAGRVHLGVTDEDGKRLMVEVLQAGEVFGEIGVLQAGLRTTDAFAEGAVTLQRIPAAVFRDVLSDTPQLGRNLSLLLAERLRRTFSLFQAASFETVEQRLARQVIYLAERHGRRTERGIRLTGQLRQPDLADLLGTTTRSVITVLNAWRAREWVSYDGDKALLVVLQPARLQALVASDQRGTD